MSKSVFTSAYASLLATLIALRKAAGVTQSGLAARLGKPQSFVAKVEQGARRVDVIEFYELCRALGADPEAVFAELVRELPERVEI